ncbi:MAG: N-acetyltransferase [Alphaproteobacteria bacterium]|nr:N-acetyltransferase [Alphaproteobacteria bacterium]
MQIRPAEAEDYAAIEDLLDLAFDGREESTLVKALRDDEADSLELVAENHGKIVGTIMFSPVSAHRDGEACAFGLGLGPLAVLPKYQRQGVGQALAEAGLNFIRTIGAPWCVVLGDPEYYSKLEFKPGPETGWYWSGDPKGLLGNAFQVLSLRPPLPTPGPFLLHYHRAFTPS